MQTTWNLKHWWLQGSYTSWNPGQSSKGSLFVWSHDLEFQGHTGQKGQIWFPDHNSRCFRTINLKLVTATCLGSGKMHVHFEATECQDVKIRFALMSLSCLSCSAIFWRCIVFSGFPPSRETVKSPGIRRCCLPAGNCPGIRAASREFVFVSGN